MNEKYERILVELINGQKIEGNLHLMDKSRARDVLNLDEKFFTLKQAQIVDGEAHRVLLINKKQVAHITIIQADSSESARMTR
jgi:hypothetical protein